MADIPTGVLSTDPIEYILQLLLRRAPYPPPSDPASQHRAAIVSSSLDQGSPAERISSSLALCQDFGFGFGLVFRPCLRTGPFFALQHAGSTRINLEPNRQTGVLSSDVNSYGVRLTGCRRLKCMAGMLTFLLLTKWSKPILALSPVTPLRILLPRTRV